MKINKKELQSDRQGNIFEPGYRIVCFYNDNSYEMEAYCKTIEGFMIGFAECDPIMDESDIPSLISIEDLLNRYLNDLPDITAVALYKTDGTCLQKKTRALIK